MWRRIISNRDPRDTIFTEIRKEFNPYFGKANQFGSSFIARYPRLLFGAMILLLVLSLTLRFTVFRHPQAVKTAFTAHQNNSTIQDGFSQIMLTAGQIRQTLALKHLVDSIMTKKYLSREDSTLLDTALSRLQRIHDHQQKTR
jgi:hypothetical protein